MIQGDGSLFRRRTVEAYYSEAMLLADEARSYFESVGIVDRSRLDGEGRVHFACESLKVTTRLMHVIAWLLDQRAIAAGEIAASEASARKLGTPIESDAAVIATLPAFVQMLVTESMTLFDTVARLERTDDTPSRENPARLLHARLAAAF